jgi:serine/threonine protein kinase
MKILKKELVEIDDDELRVFKELVLLRILNHPNIIKLYEFYQDTSYLYFILE